MQLKGWIVYASQCEETLHVGILRSDIVEDINPNSSIIKGVGGQIFRVTLNGTPDCSPEILVQTLDNLCAGPHASHINVRTVGIRKLDNNPMFGFQYCIIRSPYEELIDTPEVVTDTIYSFLRTGEPKYRIP